jgi:hypothetical protein
VIVQLMSAGQHRSPAMLGSATAVMSRSTISCATSSTNSSRPFPASCSVVLTRP